MDSALENQSLGWRDRPFSELVRLSWPITVSHLSFSLMTAVDTMFVGRLGAAALAGVAIAGVSVFVALCFGMGLLRAAKILVAQAVGAGRPDASRAFLGAGAVLALVFGLATALIGQLVAHAMPLITASAESGEAATTYASIRLLGAPIVLLTVALRETRHGLGDSRTPMTATLIANVANIALVALFLIVWETGIAGVAWATTFAQGIELCVLARLHGQGLGLRAWTSTDLKKLLSLGTPLGAERFFDAASFLLMIGIFARMGDVDVAAHQVAHQMFLFVFTPGMAIGEASCVLIGQAVGAASLRTIPRVQRAALAVCYLYSAFCSLTLWLFGAEIATLFTREPAVLVRAAEVFRVAAVFLWCLPFYQIGQASLRGLGDVRFAAVTAVVAAWVCTPLLAAWFGLGFGLGAPGGWIGIGCELTLASALFWWRLRGRSAAWVQQARSIRASLAPPAPSPVVAS